MRYPDPPFLELGFHFANLTGKEALWRVANVVLEGTKSRPVTAEILKTRSGFLVGSDREKTRIQQKIHSSAELLMLLNNPELLVTKFVVDGALQFVKDASEIITMIPIESDDPGDCGNSVAICFEGASLSFPGRQDSIPGKAFRIGGKVRTIFIDFVQRLKPSYASITVDYGLEAPCDLKRDPRTHAFRDFFLCSERYFELIDDITHRFPTLHYDRLQNGLFVITTNLFACTSTIPNAVTIEPYALSEYVGRRLAMT